MSPHDLHSLGDGGALICDRCQEWHDKAARHLLENTVPQECQMCGLSVADMARIQRIGVMRLHLAVKDGIYQVLCDGCKDDYAAKRRDLYGPTLYGRKQGIA